jgi:hypothetical protein
VVLTVERSRGGEMGAVSGLIGNWVAEGDASLLSESAWERMAASASVLDWRGALRDGAGPFWADVGFKRGSSGGTIGTEPSTGMERQEVMVAAISLVPGSGDEDSGGCGRRAAATALRGDFPLSEAEPRALAGGGLASILVLVNYRAM